MADQWYIARDKKKHGPYSSAQMKQMAKAGQLQPADMVLQEGTPKWMPAAQVEAFFPLSEPAPPSPPALPVAIEPADWRFTKDGQQAGPVTWTQLRQLASSGQLLPTDMLWKTGMGSWVAASSLKELFPPPPIAPQWVPGIPHPGAPNVVLGEQESHKSVIHSAPASSPPIAVQAPASGASPPQVEKADDSSLLSVVALSDLESKWWKIYGRNLELIELVIVELFHRLVPKSSAFYIFPNIPEKKLSNAKAKYAKVAPSELLLGLVDDTMFGSASNGYLLTTQGVYWHNSNPEDIGHRNYEELHPDEAMMKAGWVDRKVMLTPTTYLMASTIFKDTAEGIANFVKYASAFTLASRGDGSTDVEVAWTTLSNAMAQRQLDSALPETIRRVSEFNQTGSATSASGNPIVAATSASGNLWASKSIQRPSEAVIPTPPPLPSLVSPSLSVQKVPPSTETTPVLEAILASKWEKLYGRGLELIECVILELFHQLAPTDGDLYKFPNIPEQKLSNAKATYADLTSSELLLALGDNTLFGSAKSGFVITNQSIYWHNDGFFDKPRKQHYVRLVPEQIESTCHFWGYLNLSQSEQVVFTVFDNNAQTAEALAKFIKHAATITIASGGHGDGAAYAAAQSMLSHLSKASFTLGFDTTLSEAIRNYLESAPAPPPPNPVPACGDVALQVAGTAGESASSPVKKREPGIWHRMTSALSPNTNRCPNCFENLAGEDEGTELIDREEGIQTKMQMDETYHDAYGRGEPSRTFRQVQVVVYHDIYWQYLKCKFCDYEWREKRETTYQP